MTLFDTTELNPHSYSNFISRVYLPLHSVPFHWDPTTTLIIFLLNSFISFSILISSYSASSSHSLFLYSILDPLHYTWFPNIISSPALHCYVVIVSYNLFYHFFPFFQFYSRKSPGSDILQKKLEVPIVDPIDSFYPLFIE